MAKILVFEGTPSEVALQATESASTHNLDIQAITQSECVGPDGVIHVTLTICYAA